MSTEADRRLLAACELALVGVTASIIIGFGRLFVDWSFLPELAVLGAASHGLAILMRRTGRGIIVSAFTSLVGLVIVGSLALYPGTTAVGLPTLTTRDALRTDVSSAWDLFGVVRAPTEVHPGFVAAAGMAVWLVAFLSDWAAFRLWSPLEAVAPAAIVFLFCSLQRAEDYEAMSTALFAGAVLVFILMHRLARQDSGASWLATEPGKGRNAIVRVGSIVGAAAIVTGLVVAAASAMRFATYCAPISTVSVTVACASIVPGSTGVEAAASARASATSRIIGWTPPLLSTTESTRTIFSPSACASASAWALALRAAARRACDCAACSSLSMNCSR